MELNKYLDIIGGVTLESIAEGRFVILADSEVDGAYGVKKPSSEAEGLRAKYCVAWTPTNHPGPYMTIPTVEYALRGGFDQEANVPFNTDVSYVYPGDRKTSTIPSGTLVRLFPVNSVVTLYSGEFVPSTSYEKGSTVSVEYSGDDAGKPVYAATSGTIAIVEHYDSDEQELTLRIGV